MSSTNKGQFLWIVWNMKIRQYPDKTVDNMYDVRLLCQRDLSQAWLLQKFIIYYH